MSVFNTAYIHANRLIEKALKVFKLEKKLKKL